MTFTNKNKIVSCETEKGDLFMVIGKDVCYAEILNGGWQGVLIVAPTVKDVYKISVSFLKKLCYENRLMVKGSSYVTCRIVGFNGVVCELNVFDFPFYKGRTIERDSKTYYCDEVK